MLETCNLFGPVVSNMAAAALAACTSLSISVCYNRKKEIRHYVITDVLVLSQSFPQFIALLYIHLHTLRKRLTIDFIHALIL